MAEKKQKLIRPGFNALVWKEGELFVARAVEIEIASQGRTKKEAVNNLEEALDLYFEDKKNPMVARYANLELIKIAAESGHLYA